MIIVLALLIEALILAAFGAVWAIHEAIEQSSFLVDMIAIFAITGVFFLCWCIYICVPLCF